MDDLKLQSILYRHLIAARDLDTETANKLVRLLNAGDEELVDKIAAQYARIDKTGVDRSPAKTKRLGQMLAQVREVNAKAYKPYAEGLRGELLDRATHEAEIAAKAFKEAGGAIDIGAVMPSTEFLKSLVENSPIPVNNNGVQILAPWLKGLEQGRFDRLEQAIRLGVMQGETADDLVKRIAGTKAANYTDGILQISRQSAQTLAITANAAAQNDARLATYRGMKSIRFVEWSSILDARTSPICQMRSGDVYPIDAPHPKPPAHPRCRSVLLPRRDAEGAKHKPIPVWLRGESEAVQNEVLAGKARADVFRVNPDFDFKGFFRENGSFKSLDELKRFDERLFTGGVKSPPKPAPKARVTPEPAPAPAAPKRMTSAIDPAVNDRTVKVISRKDATKRLSETLSEAAQTSAYDSRPEFKGIKPEMFGKAQLGTGFSDEAASALAALWPEVDRIADAFKIPRLRAIRTITGNSAIANMGDGTLGVHPVHFNGFASQVGIGEAGAESAALKKAKEQQSKWKDELMELADKIGGLRDDIAALGTDPANREARMRLAGEMRALANDHRKLAEKEFKLRGQIRTLERQGGGEPVSTWKVGDDIALRPYTNDKYFSGIDKMRSTLYHEFGHHVHQMVGKRGRRGAVGAPPLERQLRAMFQAKFFKLGSGHEAKKLLTTTYATTNEFEWWAESFSAYMMGRLDLADPDLVKLIEELLDAAADA